MRNRALLASRLVFRDMPGEYLSLEILEDPEIEIQNGFQYRKKPFAASEVFLCTIKNAKIKSTGNDIKEIIEVEFFCQDLPQYDLIPGDSIAILPNNPLGEVDALVELLNLEEIWHKSYKLKVSEDTKKKNAVIPKHLPEKSTLRDIFLKYIDIRGPPKKLFLKSLLKYIENPEEHSKLELISSPRGSKEYNKFIEENSSLINILKEFPSCHLPVEAILEHSTPLQPRYYSIASYPLKNCFKILFDVVKHNGNTGICTGWLKNCILNKEKVPMYFRNPTKFRYEEISRPTILIATGTGIAPFLSFLDYKKHLEISEVGDIWLYYGCRYKNKDNLCKNFDNYLNTGCLNKLVLAHSREGEKCYVQHKIKDENDFVHFVEDDGKIYVCGSRSMEKDVRETIIECFRIYKNISREESQKMFESFVKENRYVVDVWV